MREELARFNPVSGVRVGFGDYAARMRRQDDAHRVNGIPDYAFSLDLRLREKIRKLPCFLPFVKRMVVHAEARARQMLTATTLQVGPHQFPEIYEMTFDCAKRLKIGPPNVFIKHNPIMNAYTYASDTVTPTIVIHSGIVERMTPGELKCIIAHECGHIHNEHSVYMSIVKILGDALAAGGLGGEAMALVSQAVLLLFAEWQRAAEVTCDRAAMICADDLEDAINVNKKLIYGSFLGREMEVSTEDLRSQFENVSSVMSLITELGQDHPSSIRRVLCDEEFACCEVLYQWRPELKQPGMLLRTKEETDRICEKYTAVIKEARKGGSK